VIYDYDPDVLEALARHGLKPQAGTAPGLLRDAVRDLYRYEIRALRDRLLAGAVERRNYAAEVVELRKKYWLLSLPIDRWILRSTLRYPDV
jgi:hypothetical protein